jgi:hypothetical protein
MELAMQTIEAAPNRAVSGPTDAPAEILVCAYNAAFSELGLRFRWDAGALGSMGDARCEQTRMAEFIRRHHPHLLKAYDAEFLSGLICERKNAYLRQRGLQEGVAGQGLDGQQSH